MAELGQPSARLRCTSRPRSGGPIGEAYTDTLSDFSRNPVPGGKSFNEFSHGNGNVPNKDDRWDWTTGTILRS